MSPDTRVLLANCAGSFLLLSAFVVLIVACAGLLLAWRGVRAARSAAPDALRRAAAAAAEVDERAQDVAGSVVRPQIAVASGWAGLRAALRVLRHGPDAAPEDDVPRVT